MKKSIFLTGKKINLCILDPKADLSHYEEWLNDQDTTKYMCVGKIPQTQRKLKEYILGKKKEHDILLGIFLKKSNRHIGNILLHVIDQINKRAELGLFIGDKASSGKGISVEAIDLVVDFAFNRLNLHRVYAVIVKDNIASLKAFEKVGFRKEGVCREHFFLNGEYIDCFSYSILSNEYNKQEIDTAFLKKKPKRFGKIKKIILFGGSKRLVNFIDVARSFEIIVISCPRLLEEPVSRDGKSLESCLKKKNIKYFSVNDIKKFNIKKYVNKETLGVSFGAPWLFEKDFIDIFSGKLINAHGMDLPRNRGGGGFTWKIMSGDRQGCHLFHLITVGIDSGNIVFSNIFKFPKTCVKPKDFRDYFNKTEIDFLKKFIKKIESNGSFNEIVQDKNISTYFPRLSTVNNGFINWQWDAENIVRFICSFDSPYKGATTFLHNERVFLNSASLCRNDGPFHPFMSGLIYRKTNLGVFVAAPGGGILVREIRDQKGKDMLKSAKIGHRLMTPPNELFDSMCFKAVYDSKGLKK